MSFSEKGGWWVVGQVGVFGLYLVSLIGTPSVTEGLALGFARIVGAVLLLLGAVFGVWSVVLLRRHLTPMPAPTPDAVLVEHGPYRFVRHPIYGSIVVGLLGLALLDLNPWAVVFSLVLIPFFMAKTGHEEDLLVAAFPGYRSYRSKVPHRLLPWLL